MRTSLLVITSSLILLGTLTGCQHHEPGTPRGSDPIETKTVMPVAKERSTSGDGGLLVVTEFRGRDAAGLKDTSCRWRMINKDSGKSFFVTLAPESPASFASLPSGTYLTGRLGCGINKVWDLDKIFKDGFTVEAGRVSYIGKLTFEFQGKQMKEVKKGTRTESAQALASAITSVPTGSGDLVSGFTQRPITAAMYQGIATSEGFDIQAAGLKNAASVLEALARNLKTCANTETAADPLRIGRIEYVGLYRQGRFNEMKNRTDENAFSDRMRACVEQGMMKFQSADKGEFEIRVRY